MSQLIEIVGLSGKAGSGKDHIAQTVLLPLGYTQFSLAYHLKVWIIARGLATWEEVFITKPPHVRKLLQEEGTERGRNVFGNDIWCQTAGLWMRVLAENSGITKFVIPDVRFPNEVEFIQGMGGQVWRIHAPQRTDNSSLTKEAREHISETALDQYLGFNAIIQNDPWYSDTLGTQVFNQLGFI